MGGPCSAPPILGAPAGVHDLDTPLLPLSLPHVAPLGVGIPSLWGVLGGQPGGSYVVGGRGGGPWFCPRLRPHRDRYTCVP